MSDRAAHEAALQEVITAAALAAAGGGDTSRARHVKRGKMLPRDRVAGVLDPGSPFLEVGATAAHGMYDGAAPCAGVMRSRRPADCRAFIWWIAAARTCPIRMRCFQIATTLAGSSTIRHRCRPQASRRLRR